MLSVNFQKKFTGFELDVRIDLPAGFCALFGPSGAGKTSSLNLIAGLTRPDSGEIQLNGRTLYSDSKRINIAPSQRNIGYIFQESRLFPHLSVRENLLFGYRRTPAGQRRFAIDDVVRQTGISGLLKRMPGQLSGGEKQRVALARALLASPQFLLMDEPLAALDQSTRLSFLNFLKNIHRRLEIPILYVSHDLAAIVKFADQVALIENGRSAGCGSPFQMLPKMSAPPLLAGGDLPNIFEAKILEGKQSGQKASVVDLGGLRVSLPPLGDQPNNSIMLNIPASEILLATDKPTGLSASNIFPGTVSAIHTVDSRVFVDVDAGCKFTVEIIPATVDRLGITEQQRVYLIIKASSFRRLS